MALKVETPIGLNWNKIHSWLSVLNTRLHPILIVNFRQLFIRPCLLAGLILAGFSINAQEIIIEDPELELKFLKPKKWQVYDDTFNIYLLPRQEIKKSFSFDNDYFKITYYEAPTGNFFDASLSEPDHFPENPVKRGTAKVDDKMVRWVIYDSLGIPREKRIIFYRYSKHGQDFQLTGVAGLTKFSRQLRYFRRIARSFRTRRIH